MSLRDEIRSVKKSNCMPFPKVIQIEITRRCPFNCPQCYKISLSNSDMDFDKLKGIITECHQKGTKLFVLNGGEPLLYYRLPDLLDLISDLKVEVNCFTSGYPLTTDIINKIDGNFFNLSLSLNGSTKAINDLSREGYSFTIEALELLASHKKQFGINWVARHDNVKDFPDLLALAEKYNVCWVSVTSSKLTSTREILSPLEKEDYDFLADFINNYYNDSEKKVKLFIESCFSTLTTKIDMPRTSYFNGCTAGTYSCHIDIDNNFMPCTQLHYKENFSSVAEYWQKSEILSKLRVIESDKLIYCEDCKSNKNCRFCRAFSVETHDDFSVGLKTCPVKDNQL